MTKTFEQAIAEAQKQFAENCQAIVEQYRKYPDGFVFSDHRGRHVVKNAEPYLYGDDNQMETYQANIAYYVESLDLTYEDLTQKRKIDRRPKPVWTRLAEYELDAFLEKYKEKTNDHTT